jgi:hypothetical protein
MKNLAAAQEPITGSCGHGYGCCGMEVTILNLLKKRVMKPVHCHRGITEKRFEIRSAVE